jgi:RES domain-containing protein
MAITVWRLVRAGFQATAFRGAGAKNDPGRWNSEGIPIVYTAGSASLAVLEIVRFDPSGFPEDFVFIPADLGESAVETLPAGSLPVDWKALPRPASTRSLGTVWALSRRSVALAVPSAVLPNETVYLLNPDHPDFASIEIGQPVPFSLDPRLRR